MGLRKYRQKRDFKRTPEPAGGREKSSKGRQYIIQKHAARRLHYDFRLELNGVLKSWAVPKGPSLDPNVKSLAVHVEDHPVEYASFEGVIPKGEYGGGTVMLWDRGTWTPEGDPEKNFAKGKISFELHGEKLKGRWLLVRMHGKEKDEDNWLLRKVDDEAARSAEEYSVLEKKSKSVATQRSMEQIASEADRVWSSKRNNRKESKRDRKSRTTKAKAAGSKRKSTKAKSAKQTDPGSLNGAVRRAMPAHFTPQLATLVREVPPGDGWLHELKFDGYRLLAQTEKGEVRLFTRRGNNWTHRFPTVARAVENLKFDETMLDGEVIVLANDGTSDFQALQNLMRRGRDDDVVFYVFDIPFCQGFDLTRVPLIERKELLEKLLSSQPKNAVVRYSDHIAGDGRAVVTDACRHALEGIVSKQADSRYEQRRSRSWVKVKCLKRQEFVIGGWTPPGGSRTGFGSLLLGYYRGKDLIYSGKVGTGFTTQSLNDMKKALDDLASNRNPFDERPTRAEARGAHWIEPKLVAEIEFSAWTDDDRLRHPVFVGLREDKEPTEVKREKAVSINGAGTNRKSAGKNGRARREADSSSVAGVRLSHPSRVVYPEQGITKLELARYYEEIADWILPHIVDRPLTLVRCPRGRAQQCFYQKHVGEGLPESVEAIEVPEKNGMGMYVTISNLRGLISLVQMGVLEIHPWGSRNDKLDRPDRMIFDLDPAPDVSWKNVVDAAQELRERLSDLKLESFLRTTGGKGLHLVSPLARRVGWVELKAFAKSLALSMERDNRDKYISVSTKAKRAGKIFVDYLRNDQGATAIASYSTRARAGATVATPLRWDEMSAKLDPQDFNVRTIPKRVTSLRKDPWEGFDDSRQTISGAMTRKLAKS